MDRQWRATIAVAVAVHSSLAHSISHGSVHQCLRLREKERKKGDFQDLPPLPSACACLRG